MREIKFRAWDSLENKMYYIDLYQYMSSNEEAQDDMMTYNARKNGLMQYTGLKDKNGKEIYEGDIVERKFSGNKAEIKFIDGQFCYCDLVDNLSVRYPNCNDIRTLNNWGYEIIGNIYENPKLLSSN